MTDVDTQISVNTDAVAKRLAAYPAEVDRALSRALRSGRAITYRALLKHTAAAGRDPFGRPANRIRLTQAQRVFTEVEGTSIRGWLGWNPLIRSTAERRRAERLGTVDTPLVEDGLTVVGAATDEAAPIIQRIFEDQLERQIAR